MSLKSSEKIENENSVYKLEISVDGKTFNDAVQKVFQSQRKNITVPGFRKGKATLGMIERYYGEGVFYNDAFEQLFPDVVEEAVKEAGLEIVANPTDVDIAEIGKDGLEFSLKVTVKPDVELEDYKGLEIERPSDAVTDDDVKKEIDSMLERSARFVEADREAKLDDMVTIDFEGFVDGKAFDGGKGEGYELTLGSGQFIPGFEDQIVGHKAGEEFDVNVKFPEEYAAELAGKDATFKVKLNVIKEKQLPELNDDFAMDVSEYDTLDELKAHTKEDLEKTKKQTADNEVDSQIFDKLASLVKTEIPAAMFESEIDNAVNEFGYQMQSQGIDLKTYLQYTGMTEAQLRDSFRERSENQVKCRLALEKIAELENAEVTKEDIDAQYKKLAEDYGMEEENIRKILAEEDIAKDVKTTKALDAVKASAKITDAKPAKKAAAKKPAAKKTTAKKAADDKAEDKKPAAKKTTAKKTTTKKAADSKAEDKKPAAKKTAAKKTTAAKKAPAKKAAAKAEEDK